MKQQTIILVAVAAIAGYYFLVMKPEADKKKKSAPTGSGPVAGAPPGSGLSETQAVLGGTANIITATGTAAAGILDKVWPD